MPKSYDTRKSLVALDQDSTLIAVIEMSQEGSVRANRLEPECGIP